MKKVFLFFIAVLFVSYGFAQEELPTVVPDRPGYTWSAEVMPYTKCSWENGISYEKDHGSRTIVLPSSIYRQGIFKNVEFRIGADFLLMKQPAIQFPEDPPQNTIVFGMTPLTFGTKILCNEGKWGFPSVSFLAQVQSPHLGSTELRPDHLAPSMYLIFENDINDWFSICYNVGSEWDGESAKPTTFLGLALYFSFNDQLGAFVDTYNYLNSEEGNQYMLETGLYWQVSRRVQLDIEGDLDLENLGKYYSVGCGVSWLIN